MLQVARMRANATVAALVCPARQAGAREVPSRVRRTKAAERSKRTAATCLAGSATARVHASVGEAMRVEPEKAYGAKDPGR